MIADVAAALFVVVIIYILVRPQSQGILFVQAFSTLMTAIVSQAADLASPAATASTDGN